MNSIGSLIDFSQITSNIFKCVSILNPLKYLNKNNINIKKPTVCHKTAILTCVTLYCAVKAFKTTRKLYRKWYAKRLNDYFESLTNSEDHSEANVDSIKNNFLLKKMESLKKERLGKTLRIVEIGYCGSNFSYMPPSSSVTLCNSMQEFNSFLFDRLNTHAKHVWLYHDNVSMDFKQLRSNSVDVVICTHYMCCFKDKNFLINEIYRILKPDGVYLFIEHVVNTNSFIIRFAQYLFSPIWSLFNDGCSLSNSTLKIMESSQFSLVDQTYCSINLVPNNWLVNSLMNLHVLGYAIK